MVSSELVQAIIAQHKMRGTHSIHFVDHWARVMAIGRRLARETGARQDVVDLFAVFHDAGRVSDSGDRGHGARGALLAEAMRGSYYDLDEAGMILLVEACNKHTWGLVEGDITVLTCWDSDRLDLGRAGIYPSPDRLGTPPARAAAMIARTYALSVSGSCPNEIFAEWGLEIPLGRGGEKWGL